MALFTKTLAEIYKKTFTQEKSNNCTDTLAFVSQRNLLTILLTSMIPKSSYTRDHEKRGSSSPITSHTFTTLYTRMNVITHNNNNLLKINRGTETRLITQLTDRSKVALGRGGMQLIQKSLFLVQWSIQSYLTLYI